MVGEANARMKKLDAREIERRSVKSRYHGTAISGYDGNVKEKGKKIICLYLQTTTLHVHHAISYISLLSLHHFDLKLPNFTSPLFGVGEHNTETVAFYF